MVLNTVSLGHKIPIENEHNNLTAYTVYKYCSTPSLYEPQPVDTLQFAEHSGYLTGRTGSRSPCDHSLFFVMVREPTSLVIINILQQFCIMPQCIN